ncbi:MAG: 4-hydroxy-tetrahydrodipicolinate reductase [Candidatus Omnitrophota bacterium]|nr:MAG: 4-hydroxy-tetrahydrodipicolinate reductase [Candidatus Omnitrophota bacterium]
MIKLAVNGCLGKMGQRILNLAFADSDFIVKACMERPGHSELNSKIGDVAVTDDLNVISAADLVIDFSAPSAAMDLLAIALKYKKPMVIGTTGLDAKQIDRLKSEAKVIPIVFSPNMSVGVNVLFALVKAGAEKLKDYQVSIIEEHHIHKKDAPSGTAKKLAEIVNAQVKSKIGDIQSIREDEIIGNHQVKFESELDTIVLSHSAKTRDIFAMGALRAAKWIKDKPAGFFTMQDVLA